MCCPIVLEKYYLQGGNFLFYSQITETFQASQWKTDSKNTNVKLKHQEVRKNAPSTFVIGLIFALRTECARLKVEVKSHCPLNPLLCEATQIWTLQLNVITFGWSFSPAGLSQVLAHQRYSSRTHCNVAPLISSLKIDITVEFPI
jgi:hypothetical protein